MYLLISFAADSTKKDALTHAVKIINPDEINSYAWAMKITYNADIFSQLKQSLILLQSGVITCNKIYLLYSNQYLWVAPSLAL